MSNVTDINEYKKKKRELSEQDDPIRITRQASPEPNSLEEVEQRTALVREKVGKIAEGMKALREAEQKNAENEARLKKVRKDYNKRTSRDYGLDRESR